MPLPLSLGLMIAGLALLWLKKTPRTTKYMLTAGVLLLLAASNRWVAYSWIHGLEDQFPALQPATIQQLAAPRTGPLPIVVLSAGFSAASTFRTLEGIRLYRWLDASGTARNKINMPERARLIFSGGRTLGKVPEALPMERLAASLGVPQKAIEMETGSDDTYSEARDLKPILKKKPFILVTSASHMPRAMALFRHVGLRPVAAPCNYAFPNTGGMPIVISIIPDLRSLSASQRAWHERLGRIWEKLRGQ